MKSIRESDHHNGRRYRLGVEKPNTMHTNSNYSYLGHLVENMSIVAGIISCIIKGGSEVHISVNMNK